MAPGGGENRVHVHVFGALRPFMRARGLPDELNWGVPLDGLPAERLAQELGLPTEKVEAVFRNGKVVNIHDIVYPGDRLAFCPYGTPGPYRVFLGMARENNKRSRRE